MARLYEIPGGDHAWNPVKCEETALLIAYQQILPFIPAGETWRYEFEKFTFDDGYGIADRFIELINTHRRRHGLSPVVFQETDVDDYARDIDRSRRVEHRRILRDEIRAMSEDARQRAFDAALAEAALLPPPHRNWEEYKARRDQYDDENQRSREAAAVRLLANEKQRQDAAKAETRRLRVLRMLKLANAALQDEIIAGLSADDALELAEQIDDADELRNALVRRAFNADQE
jgi:hypothetical protein